MYDGDRGSVASQNLRGPFLGAVLPTNVEVAAQAMAINRKLCFPTKESFSATICTFWLVQSLPIQIRWLAYTQFQLMHMTYENWPERDKNLLQH